MNGLLAALGVVSSLLWLSGALQKRARLRRLAVLTTTDRAVSCEHVFVVRPGVMLDEATERAASNHARAHKLQLLDLIPVNLPSYRLQLLLRSVNPRTYRSDPTAPGYTVGEAMLVERQLLDRARLDLGTPRDGVDFERIARQLKRYAVDATDRAVAPSLRATPLPTRQLRSLARNALGNIGTATTLVQLLVLLFLLVVAPVWGLLALLTFQMQLLVATLSTPLTPADRVRYALLRAGLDAFYVLGPGSVQPHSTERAELRSTYATLLANGTAPFFESPRPDCPLCRGTQLSCALRCGDGLQGKPGTFTLSRCKQCGHIFQNPRLSITGLNFYYRDFYDGLGKELFDASFPKQAPQFKARTEMVARYAQPSSWLDVGAGGGHFCCYARGLLPNTRFDGLDLSAGVEEAERRGWVHRGIRALFPEAAQQMAPSEQRYDVVSMSHYLEHTLDPRVELDAAAKVLRDDGLLLIELPDPQSRIGRIFGRLWLPWLQPQHLHFLSVENLDRLLRERSFEPLRWHRGEAHIPNDWLFIAVLAIMHITPHTDWPWRAPVSGAKRAAGAVVWFVLTPVIVIAWLLDFALLPIMRRPGWSNTFRVVARKTAPASALS